MYFSKLISRNAFQNIRIKKLFIESFSPRREFQNDSRIIEIEWREPYLITFCLFKMFKSQGHFFDKYLFRFYLSSTSACNDPMSCDFSFFSYHFLRLSAQQGARVWVSSSKNNTDPCRNVQCSLLVTFTIQCGESTMMTIDLHRLNMKMTHSWFFNSYITLRFISTQYDWSWHFLLSFFDKTALMPSTLNLTSIIFR